jgi:hypothetical protein
MDSYVPGVRDFIWHDRLNRRYLFAFLFVVLIVWVIFKFLYPYPNIIFDSYNYMRAAALHWNFNAWPIGYSKILQFFTSFSHSANLLVTVQYFFLELSCAVFFFTWLYFFRPRKAISHILFGLLFLNPVFAYISNYILSDPFFIGLSVLWITQILWIVYRPSPYMILTNAILLTLAFTIRYSALYYPLVVILALILSRQSVKLKLAGISLPILLMMVFVQYTSNQAASVTG